MKSKKLAALFLVISLASSPVGAWGFLLPYANQMVAALTPGWIVVANIARAFAEAIATHPNQYPKHL